MALLSTPRPNRHLVALAVLLLGSNAAAAEHPATSVLSPGSNSLFFSTAEGRPVALGGSHFWENMSDQGPTPEIQPFDWPAYLDWLEHRGHNLIRLWTGIHHTYMTSECTRPWYMSPVPWSRSRVPGARDGGNKFDLTAWNESWFERLQARVHSAGERGMYVLVMLFDGWDVENNGGEAAQFRFHPFDRHNNINGIGFYRSQDAWRVLRTETEGGSAAVWQIQKAYLHKVMDTLGEQPNVIYEVVNEAGPGANSWEEAIVAEEQAYRSKLRYQHPIVRSYAVKGASNDALYASAAEGVIIRVDQRNPPRQDPPVTANHVIFTDGDHNCGVCNGMSARELAQIVLSGNQYLIMDGWQSMAECYGAQDADDGDYDPLRYTLGSLLRFLNSLDLSDVVPVRIAGHGDSYAMGQADNGYAVLVTGGKEALDLSSSTRSYRLRWHDLKSHSLDLTDGGIVQGGREIVLSAPNADDHLAFLSALPGIDEDAAANPGAGVSTATCDAAATEPLASSSRTTRSTMFHIQTSALRFCANIPAPRMLTRDPPSIVR
jgi:hypothetical protein